MVMMTYNSFVIYCIPTSPFCWISMQTGADRAKCSLQCSTKSLRKRPLPNRSAISLSRRSSQWWRVQDESCDHRRCGGRCFCRRPKATVINKGDSIEHILDQLRATVLPKDQVRQVSTKTAYAVPGFGKSIALIDLGVKHSVLRQLSQRDCNVTVYPYDISYDELMEQQPDGVILSSGPGDPHQVKKLCRLIQKINGQIPIWGMGLGAQVLAQAYGSELAPMEVGHFGLNIPVREIATGKIEMTSQNHLYSIARDSLPHDLLVTHENVNDHSIEAFRHRYQPILGVQFQVDASPGPRENLYFYDEFLELIDAKIHESRREKE